MNYYSPMDIWWKQVPGASQLQDNILNALLEGQTIWLSGYLPWDWTFRENIIQLLAENKSELSVELRNAEDLRSGQISDMIFELVPQAQARYMPGKELSSYIYEQRLLENTIIWLYNMDATQDAKWMEFSQKLGKNHAGLRIVCEGMDIPQPQSTRRTRISYEKTSSYLTNFDCVLFAMYLTSEAKQVDGIKKYCSYLAAELAGDQIEYIADLTSDVTMLFKNPEMICQDVFPVDSTRISNAIHRTQIRCILPEIEEQLEDLILRNSSTIVSLLPFQDEFNNECTVLYDIEIRHLYHFKNEGKLNLDSADSALIDFLRDCRNMIAHHKIVGSESIEQLFHVTHR